MDNTTVFSSILIVSAGLLFWLCDRLSAERQKNRRDAAVMRVLWGSTRRRGQ
jgi:hypothetical protein